MSFNDPGLNADFSSVRNGHGCMLQYALLHLFGYNVTLDDLKNFRVRARPLEEPRPKTLTILSPAASRKHHSRSP